MAGVRIKRVKDVWDYVDYGGNPLELYPVSIMLDCEEGVLYVDDDLYSREGGGIVKILSVPPLNVKGMNLLLSDIKPYADRIYEGYKGVDGKGYMSFSQDALDALEEGGRLFEDYAYDDYQLGLWDAEAWLDNYDTERQLDRWFRQGKSMDDFISKLEREAIRENAIVVGLDDYIEEIAKELEEGEIEEEEDIDI